MAIKIKQKIKGYSVARLGDGALAAAPAKPAANLSRDEYQGAEVIHMHERVERPEVLIGSTYKVKSPMFEHALYVTINDIVLNAGTAHESRRPFEIFVNSKNMDHFQWIVALTRIMSAVFRKGGDCTFLVEEMKAVFDPRGGYFKAGGVYMPSIVAEIGAVVEDHMKLIGLIVDPELSDMQKQLIVEKRAAYAAEMAKKKTDGRKPGLVDSAGSATLGAAASAAAESAHDGAIPGATLCAKCHAMAQVVMDGCQTCLGCGYSKCG